MTQPLSRCLFLCLVFSICLVSGSSVQAASYKPIVLDPDYSHDRFVTTPKDFVKEFRAYLTSFDTAKDDGMAWGVPDFVAYQMKRIEGELGTGPKRPSPWITEPDLASQGIAPKDASYKYSRAFRKAHPNWYVRGHLAMKHHAWRLGPNADWNTHTMLNAVPQRQKFNAGIWLDLENLTADWADEFGSVWIIAGPVFDSGEPRQWLGEKGRGEMLIGIPDALFKIVIRESDDPDRPDVLAFIYPQDDPLFDAGDYDHAHFLVSVDRIEEETGLEFLTALPDEAEDEIEQSAASGLWN